MRKRAAIKRDSCGSHSLLQPTRYMNAQTITRLAARQAAFRQRAGVPQRQLADGARRGDAGRGRRHRHGRVRPPAARAGRAHGSGQPAFRASPAGALMSQHPPVDSPARPAWRLVASSLAPPAGLDYQCVTLLPDGGTSPAVLRRRMCRTGSTRRRPAPSSCGFRWS